MLKFPRKEEGKKEMNGRGEKGEKAGEEEMARERNKERKVKG